MDDLVESLEEVKIKPKSSITAHYVTPGHFCYSGNFKYRDELCITAHGWKARILGWIFGATKY